MRRPVNASPVVRARTRVARLHRGPTRRHRAGPAGRAGRLAVGLALALIGVIALPTASFAAPPTIGHFTGTVSDSNLVKLDWQVSGGDSSNLLYIYDLGFEPQSCVSATQPVGCSTTFRVSAGAVYRYTLQVRNASMQFMTATIDVTVPPLTGPTTPAARVDVDMLNVQPQTLSWTHTGTGYVKITPPGAFGPTATNYPATGSLAIPVSSLPLGTNTYRLAYCLKPDPNGAAICSAATPMNFVVGPARFTGPYRHFTAVSQAVTLNWGGSGNEWFLSAPTLGVSGVWLNTPSYTIPAANVVAGVHQVTLVSCSFSSSGNVCANRVDDVAAAAGTVHFLVANNTLVAAGTTVATVTPDGGVAVQNLTAARDGTFYQNVAEGAHVAAGTSVGMVITNIQDSTEIVAGAGNAVPTWTTTHWDSAFTGTTWDASTRPNTGQPLDITLDTAGNIWDIGEFGSAVASVQGGALTQFTSPLLKTWNATAGVYQPVQPYASTLFGGDASTSISILGERVIDTGSAIYYTQGGDLLYNGTHPNHSRLIRFDRTGTDDPTTADDDRLCAVHVPGDKNEVIGVAYDNATNKVWFTESRPNGNAVLDWFVDGTVPCNNNLDYSNQSAVDAAAAAEHCTSDSQTNCIHEIDLPASAGRAGHLTIDHVGNAVWIVDYSGKVLDRFPLNATAASALQSFPLPAAIEPQNGFISFGGFPWQIRTDSKAVYLNEYGDNTLVRFDKTVANPATACASLVNGKNPCMSEIYLPMVAGDVNSHSIALVNGKLWFTISNENGAPASSTESSFGYVDTASWAAGAPTGVIYDNLGTLGTPPPNAHHAFRGIDVSGSGRVVLADMGDDAIDSLAPK
jgi:hypothetical protein